MVFDKQLQRIEDAYKARIQARVKQTETAYKNALVSIGKLEDPLLQQVDGQQPILPVKIYKSDDKVAPVPAAHTHVHNYTTPPTALDLYPQDCLLTVIDISTIWVSTSLLAAGLQHRLKKALYTRRIPLESRRGSGHVRNGHVRRA